MRYRIKEGDIKRLADFIEESAKNGFETDDDRSDIEEAYIEVTFRLVEQFQDGDFREWFEVIETGDLGLDLLDKETK